jgi:hypothetical protein
MMDARMLMLAVVSSRPMPSNTSSSYYHRWALPLVPFVLVLPLLLFANGLLPIVFSVNDLTNRLNSIRRVNNYNIYKWCKIKQNGLPAAPG